MSAFVLWLLVLFFFGVALAGLVDGLGVFGDAPNYRVAAVFVALLIFWGVFVPWLYRWDRRRWQRFKQQLREKPEDIA